MAGRHCTICIDPEKLRRTAELIAEGVPDVGIAAELRVGRMAVHRHRVAHVLAPAQAIAAAATKSRAAEAQRNQVIAAAEAGELDPVTRYLAEAAIVDYMRPVGERLERVAAGAEATGHILGVSALSGQQIRHAEARAKMGGMAATAPPGGPVASAVAEDFRCLLYFLVVTRKQSRPRL